MAHKTLIGGTAYEINGGETLVEGTAYSIKNGKTLVGGTAYEIGFLPRVVIKASSFWSYSIKIDGVEYKNNKTLALPEGTVIELSVRSNYQGGTSKIILNDTVVAQTESGTVTYSYVVSSSDVEIVATGSGSSLSYAGTITITER